MVSQTCVQKAKELLKEHVDRNVCMLNAFCAQVRSEVLKETSWVRDEVQLEFKLMSTRMQNLMLDLEVALLEKDSKVMEWSTTCKTTTTQKLTPRDGGPVVGARLLPSASELDVNGIKDTVGNHGCSARHDQNLGESPGSCNPLMGTNIIPTKSDVRPVPNASL